MAPGFYQVDVFEKDNPRVSIARDMRLWTDGKGKWGQGRGDFGLEERYCIRCREFELTPEEE